MNGLQRIEIRQDYPLEDLPRSTPTYLYSGAQQCNEIMTFEFKRFRDANHALVQEYHDHRQPDLDVQQLSDLPHVSNLHQQPDRHQQADLHNPRHRSDLHHQRYHQPRDLTDYILFRFVNSSVRDEYLKSEDTASLSVLSGDLLLLKMVTPERGGTSGLFHTEIQEALRPMGLHRAIKTFSNTTIKPPGGETSKQADEAWGPKRPPRGYSRYKPTVVLEVGVSESSAKLRRDAQFWLDTEKGQANLVLTCKLDRKMPIIILNTWERTENRAIRCSQHIVLSKKNKESQEISKTYGSLTIPFSHLFRRDPEGPCEKDLVLGEESLEVITRGVWEDQRFWEEESS